MPSFRRTGPRSGPPIPLPDNHRDFSTSPAGPPHHELDIIIHILGDETYLRMLVVPHAKNFIRKRLTDRFNVFEVQYRFLKSF